MSQPYAAPIVERADARHRYEVLVDGERAGLTAYRDHDDQRVFYHTEIDEAHAGQGRAAQLVQQALTDVRALGKRIVPVCPYVAKYLKKHEEFADITDPVTPDVLRCQARSRPDRCPGAHAVLSGSARLLPANPPASGRALEPRRRRRYPVRRVPTSRRRHGSPPGRCLGRGVGEPAPRSGGRWR
jgi:predicted GNAT family acetyltransferase